MQIRYLEIVTKDVDAVCAAYAATNGVQFYDGPEFNINSGNFGRIAGARTQSNLPRFIQLSLKLKF